ncbi:MAG: winged helix-turn-helix transcriptional regulator [Candidatus Omnitrophica bacterium]|nr:winged helix-turn-helix transcriptional regulator [Candidatus Omnitrophota bacterium]
MTGLLPRLVRGIARYEHSHLTQGKMTLPQLWALECLSRQDECAMNKLARQLGVSKPAATGLATRMIHQGWARRTRDRKDRRIVRVNITAKGQRIIRNVWDQKRKAIAQVFGSISPKDRAEYLSILEKVVQSVSQ